MTNRHSTIGPSEILYSFWLIFDADGSMRFLRTVPSLKPTERGMRVTAKLPRDLFRTPQLTATIDVPSPGIEENPINAEVLAAGGVELSRIFGVGVRLEVKDPAP